MQDHQYHCFQTFPTLASAFARSALAPDPPRRLEDNWRACCSRDVSRLMVDGRRGILSCSNAEVCVVLLNKNVKNTDLSWFFPSIASKIIFISSPSTSSQNPVTNNFPAGLLPRHPQSGLVLVGLPLSSIDWYWHRFLSLKLEATRLTQQAFKV